MLHPHASTVCRTKTKKQPASFLLFINFFVDHGLKSELNKDLRAPGSLLFFSCFCRHACCSSKLMTSALFIRLDWTTVVFARGSSARCAAVGRVAARRFGCEQPLCLITRLMHRISHSFLLFESAKNRRKNVAKNRSSTNEWVQLRWRARRGEEGH